MKKTDEWLTKWRSHIGAGRSAAAAGIHEYMSPLQLYQSMTEVLPKEPPSAHQLRGILLEPVALARLQQEHPDLDVKPHDQDKFVYNDAYPWASDLPDGWMHGNGEAIPVQVKVPTPENWARLEERIPYYILCNCIHSAVIQRVKACLLVCLNPVTMALWQYVVEPSEDEAGELMAAEQRFYEQHIVPRIPPEPKTAADIKIAWPRAREGKEIFAANDIASDVRRLRMAKARIQHEQQAMIELELRIKLFMQDSEILSYKAPTGEMTTTLATWRSHDVEYFDEQEFKQAHPQMYAAFRQTRSQRRFLPKHGRDVPTYPYQGVGGGDENGD